MKQWVLTEMRQVLMKSIVECFIGWWQERTGRCSRPRHNLWFWQAHNILAPRFLHHSIMPASSLWYSLPSRDSLVRSPCAYELFRSVTSRTSAYWRGHKWPRTYLSRSQGIAPSGLLAEILNLSACPTAASPSLSLSLDCKTAFGTLSEFTSLRSPPLLGNDVRM